MVPRIVLTRSGLISLNTAISVNTVQPRTAVNNAGPIKNVINNAYSTARRPFNKITAANNSSFTKKVNTVKGTRVNTARPKAVLSVVKGNKENVVKTSACWVWRPKHKILDHVSKNNGASMSFKRFNYINAQGGSNLTDYEEINRGFVAFGGNSKGGKITGKDFKLTDESHVLLKVPRKDNMYSVDLKNVVPQGGIENLIDLKVKVIRCDNRTEFKNRVMNQFCEMKGIKREFSVARTPQQNGVAERKNRTLIEVARTIKLALSFMRPFGCPVTILNTIDHLGKFDGKADEGFFVGYSTNSKAFRVFNSRTRIVEEHLHVQFSENRPNIVGSGPNWLFDIDALTKSMNYKPVVTVPGKDYILLPLWTQDLPFSSSPKDSPDAGYKPSGEEDVKDPRNEGGNPSEEGERVDQEKDANVNSTNNINIVSPTVNAAGIEDNVIDENIVYGCVDDPNIPNLEEIGRFSDAKDDGAETDITNLDTHILVSPILTTRIHKDHPVEQIIGDIHSAPQTRRMTKSIEAIQEELLQFKLQEVLTLVELPNGKRAIGTKWVFRNKRDERGIVIKNKARLVTQGYTQEERINYDEVFTPVSRIEAIRLFLAYASFKDFVVYQMDVKSAFLYGKIEKEVYVCQPPGFEDPDFPDRVYKVEKALYGLHQAPRAWYETLSNYLLENRFQRGQIDKTLFIKKDKGDILLVQVYVDDIIFGSTKKSLCTEFEKMMHKKFQMSSMGELTFFLGLQTASTPMETHKPLLKDADGEDIDEHMYRSMIGSLILMSWQCKKQTVVANSITEAEYVAASSCCGQVLWIQNQLLDYRDSNEKKLIQMIKIHTDKNVADFLTKAFDKGIRVNAGDSKLMLLGINLLLLEKVNAARYALTVNPTIYTSCIQQFWATVKVKTGEVQLQALVDGKKIITTESSITRDLQLEDAEGIDCLPNAAIFEQLTLMGIVKNVDNVNKFLMYPRFVQVFVNQQAGDMSNHKRIYVTPSHTKKVFGNMKREGKGSANPTDPQHTPTIAQPSSSQPQKKHKLRKPEKKDTHIPQSSVLSDNIAEKAINEENAPTHSMIHYLVTTQALEIDSLKRRVKKLEKKQRSRTHGLRRLYKVGLSARVISFEDEGLGEEDASKHGRKIHDIDADEDITLDSTYFDTDLDIFGVHDLDGDEVFVETEEPVVNAATTASIIPVSAAKYLSNVDMTLAQALAELKNAKPKTVTTAATTTTTAVTRPKAKGIAIQEQEQASTPITSSKDDGKGIMVEEPLKMKKKDQVLFDEKEAIRLQAQFDEEAKIAREKAEANAALILLEKKRKHFAAKRQKKGGIDHPQKLNKGLFDKAMKRVNTFVDMDTELVGGSEVRAKDEKVKVEVDNAKEAKELKQCLEVVPDDGDDVTIDATPLEDLEVLWRIVKARFKKTEPVNHMDTFLHLNLKIMFEHHVEYSIWKNQQGLVKVLNWKLFYSCGVHCVTVQTIPYYLLVEKMYPLTKHTLHQIFNNVKLQVDYESEMAYELIRLVKKQLKDSYVPQ
ncbi:putative ribonuclease H-like domain-containing protein [Tanacetum coccineum]|uniref:Ribonuclease H-like domain-containing protein n=1 Tax=Tanacetum coccineum TaxID=301880 RepID=A0ABQ4Y0E2_9ASTR